MFYSTCVQASGFWWSVLWSFARQVCRVVAEIQTRAAMLLALYMNNVDFAKLYISQCGSSLDMLKVLAKDCSTGNCP